jgi:hypothetical protein
MQLLRHVFAPFASVVALATGVRTSASTGVIESVTRLTAAPARYERVDFVVTLTGRWQDPHRSAEARLDLELVAPSGAKLVVPAFFERGDSGATSVWLTRFAPREAGTYRGRYVFVNQDTRHESAEVAFEVAPSQGKGFLHMAGPWAFRFDNGTPFRGIGENLCWESRSADDSRHFRDLHENARYNYEYLLGTLRASGGTFFRTWMCQWNLPLEWKRVADTTRYVDDPGHFNASAAQRLDELVELAAASDTYFMLALDPHGSFMGDGWAANSYNRRNGGPAATPAEFFSSPAARAQYRDRLRYLVARWGYSPHLAIWEFFNEVDNAMHARGAERIPDALVAAWHGEMSAYLQELDPYDRPITTSVSHRDVAGLAALPGLDFNQRHIYKNTDSIPAAIRRGLRDTGKPYVIGEFSYEWDWSKNFNEFAGHMDRDFKDGLWLGLFSPTPILPMSWWWEFFDVRQVPAYFARVRALHEQMLAAGGGEYTEVGATWQGAALRHVLAVRCGQATFVLLGNREEAPAAGRLILPATGRGQSVRLYDPETNLTLTLPELAAGATVIDAITVPATGNMILIVTEQ